MTKTYVPHIDNEVVQKIADEEHFGDSEKVPTTTARSLSIEGVSIESRYGNVIDTVLCDSKATKVYCVTLKPCTWGAARETGKLLSNALTELDCGYNGLHITGPGGGSIDYHPHWDANHPDYVAPLFNESVRRH
ncbi:hypothetical protein [Roseibium album]|uniref:hypothetical protein n=1 Tax=Roseibium album TaxID=311410 RepID=UPI003296F688